MRGRREERIEAAVDHLAAAVLGVAAGYALFHLIQAQLFVAAAGGALVYLVTARLLRAVPAERPTFDFPVFRIADLELAAAEELLLTDRVVTPDADELLLTEQVELVLTDADRLQPPRQSTADELVLDDILAELGPQSRVVRLFDPSAMPTPAQLNARIEEHLREPRPAAAPGDASQALYEALAELRRSLR
jgi:hypothetical protein